MAHVPRIHWPEPLAPGQLQTLDGPRAHHLLRVLKRQAGDELLLFQAPDREFSARIKATQRQSLDIEVLDEQIVRRESPLQTRLVQAVSRGDRMDTSVQKSVELGVGSIQPVLSRRSGVQLDGKRLQRKQEHWQAIALSAAEQSGRTVVPEVLPCLPLAEYLQQPRQGLVLAPDQTGEPPSSLGTRRIDVLIGPEGGLDEQELELAVQAGLRRLTLGPRVLRTETAGPAALAWLQARWGDLP